MTKEIKTEILIQAPVSKVWKVLTHIQEYPNWNSFIKKLEGILKVGENLRAEIQPVDSSTMIFKPKVLQFEENRTLQWKGKFLINGLFDGTHSFELVENQDGSTIFKQSELFNGVLVGLFNLENTIKGFEAMNRELKRKCEE
jgi:hypothetical protein